MALDTRDTGGGFDDHFRTDISLRPVLTGREIARWDAYTIAQGPRSAAGLMESAAEVFCTWFTERFSDKDQPVVLLAGPGNNGGDALCIARLLVLADYSAVHLLVFCEDLPHTEEWLLNRSRLPNRDVLHIFTAGSGEQLPALPRGAILVDGLFGAGLNRPLADPWSSWIDALSAREFSSRIAIDIPSGAHPDHPSEGPVLKADWTVCFEVLKRSALFAGSHRHYGRIVVLPIGLSQDFHAAHPGSEWWVDAGLAASLCRSRDPFSHKGSFGKAYLICGSARYPGAALLSARACLRAGAGLVFLRTAYRHIGYLAGACPEIIPDPDLLPDEVSSWDPDLLGRATAVAVGSGLGHTETTTLLLRRLLATGDALPPLVLDADALNILAADHSLLDLVPAGTILTPHPGEFDRLFGEHTDDYTRYETLCRVAEERSLFIVLKGAYTRIATPYGHRFFNLSGNPGMAKAGSGDVLTGILCALLAQGYPPLHACLLGVYLHGLAGDLAVAAGSVHSLLASDITEHIPAAYKAIIPVDL